MYPNQIRTQPEDKSTQKLYKHYRPDIIQRKYLEIDIYFALQVVQAKDVLSDVFHDGHLHRHDLWLLPQALHSSRDRGHV